MASHILGKIDLARFQFIENKFDNNDSPASNVEVENSRENVLMIMLLLLKARK